MGSLSKYEYTMNTEEVTIEGIVYKISSTTRAGLKAAIKSLRKSLKSQPTKKTKEDNGDI